MANHKPDQHKSSTGSNKTNKAEVAETLREARKDPAAKEAQKKEKQPRVPDDLSPLVNRHEVGTSGGDQRASEEEIENEPASKN